MEKDEIQQYKKKLKLIESQLSDSMIKNLSDKEKQEYIRLVSEIKAKIKLLEEL